MPSQLDLAIDATIARLMDNDGPLSLTYAEKYGVQMPVFAKAPGNMSDYLAFFCATHADKEFLVDGDIRLSFADTYSAARALAGGLVDGYGLQKGDRVGIAARNSANWIVAYMAIVMAGGKAANLPKAFAWSVAALSLPTHSALRGWRNRILEDVNCSS